MIGIVSILAPSNDFNTETPFLKQYSQVTQFKSVESEGGIHFLVCLGQGA